jgi:hypothetical protein
MRFVGTDKTLNRARSLKWRACSSRFDGSIKTGQALGHIRNSDMKPRPVARDAPLVLFIATLKRVEHQA